MTVDRLLFCFYFLFLSLTGLGKSGPDSVIVRHFQTANYKATAFNYNAVEDNTGVVFFANESGVLQYDGSQWKLLPLNNFSSANALLLSGNRIYVGGRNELGYLQKDSLGFYNYKSLRHLVKLDENETLSDIWQVVAVGKDIYFCSWKRIFRYDGQNINIIPADDAFIFKINEQLFASSKAGLARVLHYQLEYVNKDFKFDDDMAFQYLEGLKGENFIVTADNGIFLLDTVTYKTKKWKIEASEQLEKNSVYHIVKWPDSLYAVATYLGGLMLMNSEGEIVKSFTKETGLLGNELRELLIDKRGNLWITSDHGLNYLVKPTPASENPELTTYINRLTIAEKDIGIIQSKDFYETPQDYEGSIIFHFATPGFDRQELEYSHFLEGFEDSWSPWKTEVKKEYTNLDAGTYTFHVKARYGTTESQKASMTIDIPVSWYKTSWAYAALILFVIGLVGYGFNYRTRRLEIANKNLEAIIQKRTLEIEKQREQLEISNSDLMLINVELDNFVYRSSHDLVAPLKSLKGLINISQLETNVDSQKEYFNLMRVSIDKLEEFIKSIMEYSSNNKKAIVYEEIDLNKMLDDVVEDLKYYDRADKIELIRNINEDLNLFSDGRRLKIVLSNLITNSIKYHNYEQNYLFIEIRAFATDQHIQIDVIDNGNGIDEAYLDKIFDMFFRATEKAQGSGLGLYIVRDTVRKIGGEIKVASTLGSGTTFTLYLPKSETSA